MGIKVLNINTLLDDIRFVDVKGNTWRLAATTGGLKFRDLVHADYIQAYIVRNDKDFNSDKGYHYIAGLIISFDKQTIEASVHRIGAGWNPLSSVSTYVSLKEDFRTILYSRKNFIQWVETQLLGAYQNHFSRELLR
jgi:hypothetical protein